MVSPDYDALVAWLRDQFGERLRWTASFDSDSFSYDVRYVREDLKSELTEQRLDTMIHRSLTTFGRERAETVYQHLGAAEGLVVVHERATAVHLYLGESRGVVVKLQRDTAITLPDFFESCLAALGVTD